MRSKSPAVREGAQPAAPSGALPTPSAAFSIPRAPASLNGKKIARRVWTEVFTAGSGAYNPATDSYVIERYADLHERRTYLTGVIDREGVTVVGSQGQLVQHPAARLLYQTEQQMVTLEDRLGLNPEARLRLNIASNQFRSDLERFMDDED